LDTLSIPRFEFQAFFVPEVGGGLGGGDLAGFGTAVVQDDFGGADDPVVAFIIRVGICQACEFVPALYPQNQTEESPAPP